MRTIRTGFHGRQTLVVLVSLAVIRYVQAQHPATILTPSSPVIHGSFQLPEISAAGFVGNRLLIAADDAEKKHGYHMVDCLADPLNRLTTDGSIAATSEEQIYRNILLLLQGPNAGEPDPERINDLEDMAVAPTGDVYLITSHSLNKKNKELPERRQLLRVRFDRGTTKPARASLASAPLVARLPKELQEATHLRPGAQDAQHNYTPGLNIEGLAWAPDNDLLIGLRSPLVDTKAVVLRMRNVDSAFERPTDLSLASPITIEATLDLRGMGIRGMCYDEKEKGYWIIAGIAPDPDDPDDHLDNDWTIWFWNANHELSRRWGKHDLPPDSRLDNPEAICIVPSTDTDYSLLLISDNDKNTPSSYVLVPRSQLK